MFANVCEDKYVREDVHMNHLSGVRKCMCMSLYECTYVYMWLCIMCGCISVYASMGVCMIVYLSVWVYVYKCVIMWMCANMYVVVCGYAYDCIQLCECMCMSTCMCVVMCMIVSVCTVGNRYSYLNIS